MRAGIKRTTYVPWYVISLRRLYHHSPSLTQKERDRYYVSAFFLGFYVWWEKPNRRHPNDPRGPGKVRRPSTRSRGPG